MVTVTSPVPDQLVRLLREHPHGGKRYAKGTRLRVSKELRDWWIGQGIAVDAGAAPVVARPPSPVRPCCGRK